MKILLATSAAVPNGGGIASYNQELVNAFGNNNTLCLLSDSDESDVPGFEQSLSNYGKNIFDYGYCTHIINIINNASFDIIINSRSSIIPFISPFLTSPIVSISHFVNGIQAENAGYNNKYLSKIIALSTYGKDFIKYKFNIQDEHKIEVVYNFIAGNESQTHFLNKINNNTLNIVYPGSTSINKSADVVLDALFLLHRSNLRFNFFWIGGTVLPSANFSIFRFKNIKQLFRNDPRINILGQLPRKESMQILALSNVFVLPSRGEGCPMTLLEAMDVGCIPIISDAKHGSLDIIEKSKSGIIVKQDDSYSLFNAISDIILHHENYFGYYSGSHKYIKEFLSRDIWMGKMERILRESISTPKPILQLTRNNFNKSLLPFKILLYKHLIYSKLRSFKYRIKFDYIFFKRNLLSI